MTNKEKVTSNEQKKRSKKQMGINIELKLTTNEKKVVSNEQKVKNSELQAKRFTPMVHAAWLTSSVKLGEIRQWNL